MEDYKVRYKNSRFSNEKVELDGKSFIHCNFENCIIILERGETDVSGCGFKNCKLMLKGNAYTVGKIIKLFTGKSPLKVLDMEEPSTPPLPPSRGCEVMGGNPMFVILNEVKNLCHWLRVNSVKNLVESIGWKIEILRPKPQNDITTQSLDGGGLALWSRGLYSTG